MDSPLPPIWVEDEPTAAEIATETKSTQVVKIEATLEFLKDQYAVMKRANKGYRKGCREYSKPRIGERLHGLLKTASKADSRLNQWSAKHIVKMMDQHDIWSVAAKD
ncbi:hypothetical protein XH97_18155 [Bradyrhizobium sp. CCBAU 53380]|nr:hypothetical protein [Bradyrhizobium sp. CCBAU 53380]